MATIFVDPTAADGGDGSAARPFNAWWQVRFEPGGIYLQKAGTTAQAFVSVSAQGSEAAPILIASYGTGPAPVIEGMVNLRGAAWVTVLGLEVTGGTNAAIVIEAGAHHNTIIGNTVRNSAIGVWIGGAGGDNNVVANTVRDSALVGIAVDRMSDPDGHTGIIAGNTVTGSGAHGIDIHGSHFLVAGNTVSRSGLTTSGSSGIHVFGGWEDAPDGFGVGNVILQNVAFDNRDAWGPDGAGILLDQHTRGNAVLGNFATGNDGGGIVLFNSIGNTVAENVVDGNQRDPGLSHGQRGDVVLAGRLDLTAGNVVVANVALAVAGPAVLVDAATADNANLFSGNVWQNTVGGADTMRGLDDRWTAWLAADMATAGGLPSDRENGVALLPAAGVGALPYRYAAGTTQVIDGVMRDLVGWSGTTLVAGGEAVT